MGLEFTSREERKYWIYVCVVVMAIFISLFFKSSWLVQIGMHNVQVALFIFGLVLTALAVILHGWKVGAGKRGWALLLGVIAVYTMLLFRLAAPERTHLIEYSVLAIFLRMALLERRKGKKLRYPNLYAGLFAVAFGMVDEGLQLIVPYRTFDLEDIIFNFMAVSLAISTSMFLTWMQQRLIKK